MIPPASKLVFLAIVTVELVKTGMGTWQRRPFIATSSELPVSPQRN